MKRSLPIGIVTASLASLDLALALSPEENRILLTILLKKNGKEDSIKQSFSKFISTVNWQDTDDLVQVDLLIEDALSDERPAYQKLLANFNQIFLQMLTALDEDDLLENDNLPLVDTFISFVQRAYALRHFNPISSDIEKAWKIFDQLRPKIDSVRKPKLEKAELNLLLELEGALRDPHRQTNIQELRTIINLLNQQVPVISKSAQMNGMKDLPLSIIRSTEDLLIRYDSDSALVSSCTKLLKALKPFQPTTINVTKPQKKAPAPYVPYTPAPPPPPPPPPKKYGKY